MLRNFDFSQDVLYGDNTEELMNYLCKETLSPEESSSLIDLVQAHIQNTVNNKQCQMPSIGKEFQWLNTKRSLCLEADLGKKVYVIDFFTYCCINCHHILPYLKEVEMKYANNPGFAVIGIHSAKFPNEKQLQQVKEAVLRYNIEHPVLNDPDCILWETFGIVCWPTVYIVGPEKNLLFVLIGERQIEKLSLLCDQVLRYYESLSFELDPSLLPLSLIKDKELYLGLLYPGNVSTNGEDILVSDTGHHRIILMSRFLEIKEIIGSGCIGYDDGTFDTASFNSPQGTTFHKDSAYVADTGNHSIRKINFKDKTVSTVFNGKDAKVPDGLKCETGKFRSPWDVCMGRKIGDVKEQFCKENELDVLYIAVAGSHQIWALNVEESNNKTENYCVPFAGSGKEENRPNRYRFSSGFAQPSGITYNQKLFPNHLFIADSESSTIKAIELINGEVTNLVGGGLDPQDLFQFGDKDGKRRDAKLQHPMSVSVFSSNFLIIADTYNHKIKLIDVTEKTCKTVHVKEELNEPSGLCIVKDLLMIADTNNHRIVTIPVNEIASEIAPEHFDLEVIACNLSSEDKPSAFISIAKDAQIFCYFSITSSEKYVLNEKGPQKVDISYPGNQLDTIYKSEKCFGVTQPSLILKRGCNKDKISEIEAAEIIFTVSLPMCDKKLNTCSFKKVLFKIGVDNISSNVKTVHLELNLDDESKLFE